MRCWADRPIRLTYDCGDLELMSPLLRHEQYSAFLGRFVEAATEVLRRPRHSGGATTFTNVAKQCGLEPDRCYWIQHEKCMRGRKDFDPEADPPPDLAVEVEIATSALNRMSIYAKLKISEVWRFANNTLIMHVLQPDATYAIVDRSRALPLLSPTELMRFLRQSDEQDETSLILEFRAWLRKQLRPTRKPTRRTRKS